MRERQGKYIGGFGERKVKGGNDVILILNTKNYNKKRIVQGKKLETMENRFRLRLKTYMMHNPQFNPIPILNYKIYICRLQGRF